MSSYRLTLSSSSGTADLTKIVQSLNWSGDIGQIARQISAVIAAPASGLRLPGFALGDTVTLTLEGEQVFTGTLVRRSRASLGNTMELTALDGGWRLVQNQGFYKFKNVKAHQAAETVCRDFGIPVSKLDASGSAHSRKFPGASLDQILATMYTLAGEDSGKRFLPRFDGQGKLEVVEKPQTASVLIAPAANSMGIDVKEDISKLVTTVAIYSDDGKLIRTVSGQAAQDFGVSLQQVLVQRDGSDAKREAEALLEDKGLQQTVTVDCLGDPRLLTGNAVILKENATGAAGLFWIDGDTHTWKNGQYFCNLKLNFRNLMNETSGGSELT